MSRYKIASLVRGLSNPQNFWYYKNHTLVVENYAEQGMISIRASNRILSSIQLERPIHFSSFQDGVIYCLDYDERKGVTNVRSIYPIFLRNALISPAIARPSVSTTLSQSLVSVPGYFGYFARVSGQDPDSDSVHFYLSEGYDPHKKGGYAVVAFSRNGKEVGRLINDVRANNNGFQVPPKLKTGADRLLVMLPFAQHSELHEFTSTGKVIRVFPFLSFIARDFTMLDDGSIKVCGCSINQIACTATISESGSVVEREIMDFADLTQISPDGSGYLARSPNTWERPASWHITKGDQSYRLRKKPCSVWFGNSVAYYV